VTVRFLADEDLDFGIIEGLLSREPGIEILDVKRGGLRRVPDQDLLEIAARDGWIVVSHDRRTMTRHFRDRMAAGKTRPGLFIVPQALAMGEVIDSLLLVWMISELEEWRNTIVYLPFR
jgi:hypothetical protein